MPGAVLFTAKDLHKSYSNLNLFKDLSLTIHQGERVGLIGPNGSGKSTLLKIISGIETADQGELAISTGIRIAYLPQIDAFESQSSIERIILDRFPAHLEAWEIQKRLNDFQQDMQFEDMQRTFGELSGGWRKRVALAAVLAMDTDLVLLDEPTNHLDLGGILWLEDYLQKAKFSYILISHDRFFLENTCHSIMDLDPRYKQGYLKVNGTYSRFLKAREEYLNNQALEEVSLSNKVRREIEWLRTSPKARTTKAQYRIDKAHGLISELNELKQRNNIQTEAGISFDANDRKSKKLLHGQNLRLSRGGKLLFKDLELFLSPGMRLGIMGVNGSGKSSLVAALKGDLQLDAGTIELAQNIRIISLDQTRHLADENATLRRALAPEGDTLIYQENAVHVSAWAQRFLFQKDQLDLRVSQLSGGERARVLIAEMMRQPAEILILDEPTNDLDIPTLEVLEDSLREFCGAQILITHDRYLIDQVCDQILYLNGDGEIRFFADTYQLSDFQRRINLEQTQPVHVEKPASEHKHRHQDLRSKRKAFSKIERDIEKAEALRVEIESELHDPQNATDPARLSSLSQKMEVLDKTLLNLMERWEMVGNEISELESP